MYSISIDGSKTDEVLHKSETDEYNFLHSRGVGDQGTVYLYFLEPHIYISNLDIQEERKMFEKLNNLLDYSPTPG